MNEEITIRKCTSDDLYALIEISVNTYRETFAVMNTEENMNDYLKRAFDYEKLKKELDDKNTDFYFIWLGERLAGYIKLNEAEAQTDIQDPNALELERIYILADFQGTGLGRCLMDKTLEETVRRGKEYVWLGVWEKNIKALAFYQKNGFTQFGTHSFVMGDDVQNDYLLRRYMK
jgi:ribosomal protein S18 acetylase RimI-like enzyme